MRVLIGYDPREERAYDVCARSIVRRATIPVELKPLKQVDLRKSGLFWRESTRRNYDLHDGTPQSTEFGYTRFLVPSLFNEGWVLFVDCDFLFLADIAELAALADPRYAVMVCKQKHRPPSRLKMDGRRQTDYPRKNWSSLCLWNCGHIANRTLTPTLVNSMHKHHLHQFKWLTSDLIGSLPVQWNWIADVTPGEPKAVHYTEGGPWFPEYERVPYAKEWLEEEQRT